jgi:hypothetical protein
MTWKFQKLKSVAAVLTAEMETIPALIERRYRIDRHIREICRSRKIKIDINL